MSAECKKAGKVLASFVDPRQSFGPDKVIPPQILANAKVLDRFGWNVPHLGLVLTFACRVSQFLRLLKPVSSVQLGLAQVLS